MEYLATLLPKLGLSGALFVLFMAVAQLGLTQFAKDIVKAIFKRRHRPEGCTDADWAEQQDAVKRWMIWVLSLVIGAFLGALMLAPVARLLELSTPEPWGGLLAGVVLAAIVSGLVSFYQQRTDERARAHTDGLAAILAQLSAAQTLPPAPVQVQTTGQVTVTPAASPAPVFDLPAPPAPMSVEEMRPITPEETAAMSLPVDDLPLIPDGNHWR